MDENKNINEDLIEKGLVVGKEELFERLDIIIHKINEIKRKGFIKDFFRKKNPDNLDGLAEKCMDLQIKLLDTDEYDLKSLIEIKKEIVSLEGKIVSQTGFLNFLTSISVVYTIVIASMIMLILFDFHTFITNTFGIETPERYVVFGLTGAILYLITSIITGIEKGGISNFPKSLEILFRLILAMVVPIVLVTLIFGAEVASEKIKVGPELVSFACGYSSKFVIDILNKLIEKGAKVIDVI